MSQFRFVQIAFAFCISSVSIATSNGQVHAAELLKGAEFRRALREPIGPITWEEKPLRGALERLTEMQGVAIMLDRRIDPDQKVDFAGSSSSLESLLNMLAQRHGANVCPVGSVLYVGPGATVSVLPTLVAKQQTQARTLSPAVQGRLLRTSAWSWTRLTTPRSLVEQLQRDYDITITGAEHVPHDLWPAVELPPLDFCEKLSLVLAGFHVTFELSPTGDAVKLVPMPESASLERRYTPRGDAAELAKQLGERFPQGRFRAEGKQLVVDGPWETHDAVARLLAGESAASRPTAGTGEQVYTLTVENKPVGAVVKALSKQLGKTISFDDVKDQQRLATEVSASVKQASLDELLRSLLEPAGLKFEVQGDAVRVFD